MIRIVAYIILVILKTLCLWFSQGILAVECRTSFVLDYYLERNILFALIDINTLIASISPVVLAYITVAAIAGVNLSGFSYLSIYLMVLKT